jgi:lipopolysaccharide export system protein LptA
MDQKIKLIFLTLFFFCGSLITVSAQQDSLKTTTKRTQVDLLHSDVLRFDKKRNPDAQIVEGNVVFRHDSMYMYCDSAYFYSKTNSLEAFSNIKIMQGDTLSLYGNHLYYDGNTEIAMMREEVQMVHNETVLDTDSLNYDRVLNLGYYFNGGTLTDKDNTLVSDWGEYSPQTKIAVFNHEVQLTNPQFVLNSDTLKYSTQTRVATILGPSTIDSKQNHIDSQRGTYNTITHQANLLDRSVLINGPKRMTGDSLFYDRKRGIGKAFNNIVMRDTVNKNMLRGDYCIYYELQQKAIATKRAEAVDYSQGDSLYLHADTLYMNTYHLNTDSMYKEIKGYHKVRAYRRDVQASCDSLVFTSKDTCMTLYKDPVMWHGPQQLLGEVIRIYMNDSTIDWVHIENQALAVEKMDSIHYNQVTGKEMKAYFKKGEMYRSLVERSVQVGFYFQEKDSTLIAYNTSETSILDMYIKNRKLDKAIMRPKTTGVTYPMDKIPEDKLFLPNYVWLDYMRPKSRKDIFNCIGKKTEHILKPAQRKAAQPAAIQPLKLKR